MWAENIKLRFTLEVAWFLTYCAIPERRCYVRSKLFFTKEETEFQKKRSHMTQHAVFSFLMLYPKLIAFY